MPETGMAVILSQNSLTLLFVMHMKFGACKRAMGERNKRTGKNNLLPPLKVVVMSATLDVQTFENFFEGAEKIQIPGRLFPVQIVYTKEPQEVSIALG